MNGRQRQRQRQRQRERGFTLLEVLLAVAITAMVMGTVSIAFVSTLQARTEVEALNESSEAGPRILAMVERDLQGLWHHNVKDNKVLAGRTMDIAGADADRIDLLTTTDAVGYVLDQQNQPKHPTVCEVGYWLKENEQIPGLLELWRREDPMVDEHLLQGGKFQLVYDRIRSFNVTYFETVGAEAEPVVEWESSREDKLPRRVKVEITLERKVASRNEVSGIEVQDVESVNRKYMRHIVLDRRYPDILKAGVAMLPLVPPQPEPPPAGGAGGGAGPGGGGAGGKPGENGTVNRGRVSTQVGGGGTPMPGGGPAGGRTGQTTSGGRGIDLGGLFGNRGGGGGGNPFGPGGPFGGGQRGGGQGGGGSGGSGSRGR